MKRLTIAIYLAAAIILCFAASGLADSATAPSLIVKVAAGLTPDQVSALIANDGGTEISSVPALRLHIVQVPSDQLSAIMTNYQNDQQVESVEKNQTRKAEAAPSDPLYGSQWYLPKIGWDSVFGALQPYNQATVAVLDTGVDATHPDLGANVIPGTSVLDGSDGRTDPSGHGTALAGIVAAVTDNNAGMAGVGFSGVNIMPVTVLGADGSGKDADIISGVIYAADHGAGVILMGFSNPGFSQSLQDAVDYAWSKGAVIVASTGNDAGSTPTYPAGDRGVMGVSSTDNYDQLSTFSNYGKDVFIAAPGENIITTGLNSSYVSITGTSASAAVVAGAAAFLKAYDQTLTNGMIDWRIASTADAAGTSTDETGNGRINLANALAQTGYDTIEPAGAPGGGPYVGPYITAATKLATVTGASISAQSASLTYGTGGTVTYTITATRSSTADGETSNLSFNPAPSWPAGASPSLPAKVTFSGSSSTAAASLTISTTNSTPAGSTSFRVQATGANSSKGFATGTLTINPATPVFSSLSAPTITYGAASTALGGTIKAGSLVPSGNVNITLNGVSQPAPIDVTTGNFSASFNTGALNVTGSPYAITYSYGGDHNFNAISDASNSLAVNKAAASVNINGQSLSQTYDGSPKDVTANTNPAGLNVSFAYDGSATAPTAAGSYTVTASISEINYRGSTTGTLVIGPAPLTVTADSKTKVYGDADPVLTYKITSGNLAGTDAFTGSLSFSGSSVGTYAIQQGNLALNSNYTLTYVGANVTISPKAASVTPSAAGKTYGDADPALTGNMTGFLTADNVTASYSRATGENVGTYAIVAALSPADVLGNYSITRNTASFNIAPRPVTVSASSDTKVYDGTTSSKALPSVTSGTLVSGDTGSFTQTFDSKDAGARTLNPAGTINDNNGGKNYNITFVTATASITPKGLTVNAAGVDKVYDGTTAATVTLSDDRIAGDVFADSYASASFADKNAGTNKPVSVTGISISGTDAGNYKGNTTANTTATITPKTASVSPSATYKIYGDPDPVLTGTLSGFIPSDGITATYSRNTGENAGTYQIEDPLGPADALGNYIVTYNTASFIIKPRPVAVKADAKVKFYGSPDPALTYTITGGSLVGGDSFTGTLTRQPGENIGSYPIQQGTLALSSNYSLSYAGDNLSIVYNFGGFVDPVSLGWLNGKTFKQGSTIPVKFQIPCASSPSGYCATAIGKLAVAFGGTGNYTMNTDTEVLDTTLPADTGLAFRYDSTSNQYIYNLSTKNLSPNTTYQLQVTLYDGIVHTCLIYLK